MNKVTLLLLCVVSSCFPAVNRAESVTDLQGVCTALTRQFGEIETISFVSQSTGLYLVGAADTPPLVKTLAFKAKTESFTFEFNQTGGAEASPVRLHHAFNGAHYQIDIGRQLRISSKKPEYVPTLDSSDGFMMPYRFLKLAEKRDQGKTPPSVFVGLPELADLKMWAAIAEKADGRHLDDVDGKSLLVASFSGMYYGEQATIKVWFSLASGGVPVKWELRRGADERASETYEVTELEAIKVRDTIVYYPKLAKWRQFSTDGSPLAEATIEVADLAINAPLGDDVFTFDTAAFDTINDLDSKVYIKIPK